MTKALAMHFKWWRTNTDDYRRLELQTSASVEYEGETAAAYETINSTAADTTPDIYSVSAGAARDRQGVLDELYALFGGVESHYYFRMDWRSGIIYWDGADYPSVQAAVEDLTGKTAPSDLILSTQSPSLHAVAKGSREGDATKTDGDPTNHFPSICNNSTLVHLRWDDAANEIYLINDYGSGIVETLIGAAADQAALQTWLEAVYPDDDYTFAYHVTSGEICVEWNQYDAGNGNFTFSVDLQENIILEDEVEAYVIAGQKRKMESWLGGEVK